MRGLFLGVLLMLLPSCLTGHAIDETLLPAMEAAWPGVRADIERAPEGEGVPVMVLDVFEAALGGADYGVMVGVDWPVLEAAAYAGIQARLDAGEIGPGVKISLIERVLRFRYALEAL